MLACSDNSHITEGVSLASRPLSRRALVLQFVSYLIVKQGVIWPQLEATRAHGARSHSPELSVTGRAGKGAAVVSGGGASRAPQKGSEAEEVREGAADEHSARRSEPFPCMPVPGHSTACLRDRMIDLLHLQMNS